MVALGPTSGWERVSRTDATQDTALWEEVSSAVFPVRMVNPPIVMMTLLQVVLPLHHLHHLHPLVTPDTTGTAVPPSVNVSEGVLVKGSL